MARNGIAETYYELRRYKKAMEHFTKGVVLIEPCGGHRSWSDYVKTGAAMAKAKMGDKDIDLHVLYNYADKNRFLVFCGWKSRFIGEILLHIDDFRLSEAEDWVKKAIKADGKNGMILNLGMDYKLYSNILKRKGDNLQARNHLVKAIEIFKECGADIRAENAEKELSNI